MSSMTHEAGVIRLDTLDQSDYWVDRHGNQHALIDMTQSYLGNTLAHLQKMALTLYSLELRRQDDLLFLAELSGWDNGWDPSILPRDAAAAEEWLNKTPLVKAITALLDGTTMKEGNTMLTIKERLKIDVVANLKAGNKFVLATLRNVLGEISTREKSGKTPVELDEAQVTSLMQKEAAKRRDTARIYTEAGETFRASTEVAEAEIIEAYLPKALTREEVEAIVDKEVAELRAALEAAGHEVSMRSIGAVMKPVTAEVAGRFDGKTVSEIVRGRLA